MPRFRPSESRINQWSAVVRLGGKAHYLGSYPSKFLAQCAEDQFKADIIQIREEADTLWRECVHG